MSLVKDKILAFMKEEAYKPMMMEELALVFNINKGEWKEFSKVLEDMESEGLIMRTRKETNSKPGKSATGANTIRHAHYYYPLSN
jgi:ribonuclease R